MSILRLSVPYTELILDAGEPSEIRRELLGFGATKIGVDSCIEFGNYSNSVSRKKKGKEQSNLGDACSLDTLIHELVDDEYVPSFCTSCYKLGRTGKVFMEYAVTGFIQKFCMPNALLTLKEYLLDYVSHDTKHAGESLIERELQKITDDNMRNLVAEKIKEMEDMSKRGETL